MVTNLIHFAERTNELPTKNYHVQRIEYLSFVQNLVAGPGFHRGCANLLFHNIFAKKLHENKRIPWRLLRSTTWISDQYYTCKFDIYDTKTKNTEKDIH